MDTILFNYFPLILKNAKRYKHPTNNIGDLFHEALIIVINAIKFYYNIDDKTQFNTYLTFIIRREIKDSIDRYSQAVTLGKHIIDRMRKQRIKDNSGPLFEKLNMEDFEKLKEGLGYINQLVLPIEEKLEDESLKIDIQRVFDALLDRNEQFVVSSFFGLNGFDQLLIPTIAESMEKSQREIKDILAEAIEKLRDDPKALEILEQHYI